MAPGSKKPGEHHLVRRVPFPTGSDVSRLGSRVPVIGEHPYLSITERTSVFDEGFNKPTTMALAARRLQNIKRVEQHRALAVRMDQLMPIGPSNDRTVLLRYKEMRCRACEQRTGIQCAGSAK